MTLLIKNGRVIDPKTGLDQVQDVLISDGLVSQVAEHIEHEADQIIDASGLVIAPGLVDVHVHFREPGQTHKEDIHTGALAAMRGGFTCVVMMANTTPSISSVETLEEVLASAKKEAINIHSVATISKDFNGRDLTDFDALLEAGAIGFSDDGIPLTDSQLVYDAMQAAKKAGSFIALHEEDPRLNGILGINDGPIAEHFHIHGATKHAEYSMLARDAMLAYATGARVHFQHVSTKTSVEVVRFAKQLGANITAEVAPQHFSITEAALLTKGANAKMNPPLRTAEDIDALIAGLKDGTIDNIATDHAPHHRDEKAVTPIYEAPSGMTGLETALQLGLTHLVQPGHLSLATLIEKMTLAPARIFGLDAGYIDEGARADLVIFDPNQETQISEQFASKASNSPFIGERLKGLVQYTVAKGKIVYDRDKEIQDV